MSTVDRTVQVRWFPSSEHQPYSRTVVSSSSSHADHSTTTPCC